MGEMFADSNSSTHLFPPRGGGGGGGDLVPIMPGCVSLKVKDMGLFSASSE